MSLKDDLGSMGIEMLKELILRLLDKFLPGHSVDGSPDATELAHILDKIKETESVRLPDV
jgi:hypothetical protein